ncbi:sugar ABC transporter substrate-binding protein [filamentous cyanobacterium CCT1]|nr:sugar ABC transporter substrate-binding protein [filamentous cyanobacterium CCT1]PSN81592.1 sugar ABC transporter substrate-binding protein [filamentous cyanobacterium CCP4]
MTSQFCKSLPVASYLSLLLAGSLATTAAAQVPLLQGDITSPLVPLTPLPRPTSSSVPTANSDDYTLGPGDQVRMEVFRISEYSGSYEVLINGSLSLPMIGQVSVVGLTLEQAELAISQAYAQRLRRPIVNLFLTSPRPLRIGIAGEVSKPGAYILSREGTQFPSLITALEAAGGVTQSADLRQVSIQRPLVGGGRQTIVANLWQFLETGDLQYNMALRDGDTVFIPTQTSFNSREALQLAAASFSADEGRPLNIAVVGEVFRPGPYTVTGTARTGEAGVPGGSAGSNVPPTVTRAIQVAGGIKPEANIRNIEVRRRTRNGQEQVIAVDLWELLVAGDITEDIILQEGDTVHIPLAAGLPPEEITAIAAASFSPDTIRINVVGEVVSPGMIEVPPNTPLSQGVLAAGGFNNRANNGTVELIRLNPNGTATRSTLPVDFAEGIDETMNPLLRNNDIVIVQRSATAALADGLDNLIVPLGRALSLFTLPFNLFNQF